VIVGRFHKEAFFRANGFSRQRVYKANHAKLKKEQTAATIVNQVKELRKKHRNMGSRVMFHQLQIDSIGVNKFEKIVSDYGLNIEVKRKRIVTTIGFYENNDKNLINGLILNNINQVIAGDITYLILKDKTYYIFTLKDMYSRRIIGLYASETMMATNAIITLKQAIKLRGNDINNCIHHSDAGSQYKSKAYKKVLEKKQIKMSIAENCLQNGMAEQLNGVLKNDYIVKEINSLTDLNKQLTQIKQLINEERPVKELGYKTPVEFERWIKNQANPPELQLYDFTN
jgi:putative transposase